MSSIIKNRNLNFEPEEVVKVTVGRNLMSSGSNALAPSSEDDFETKLNNLINSIDEANAELEELEKRKEEIIAEANSQAEAIRNEAMQEGSEIGYNEGKEKSNVEFAKLKNDLMKQIETEKQNFEKEKKEFYKEFKEKVGTIIPKALSILFKHEVKTDPKIIDAIIVQGLMELSDEKEIRVVLSDEDYKEFDRDAFLANLKAAGFEKEVAITYDKNLNAGDCLIDTNAGFISCGINDFSNSLALLIDKNINN